MRQEAKDTAVLRRPSEAAVDAQDLDVAAERSHPVPVPPVDRLLRSPQAGNRLAALVDVVELCAHQLGEDPATPMGWQHAHDRDPGCGNDRARHRELELEGTRPADDLPVLLRDMHPLGPKDTGEALHGVLGRDAPEVVRDRREAGQDLTALCPPDLHAQTFSSGAYSSMRRRSTPSSAKRTVTIPSDAMAVTTPSPRVEWRTESPVERDGTSRRTVTVGAP